MSKIGEVQTHSLFTEYDIYLFKSGKHYSLYEKMGSHFVEKDGVPGTYFSVYAPAAGVVSVIGNFNDWNSEKHQLFVRWDESGIWEGFIPNLPPGELYKYKIESETLEKPVEKSDPFARFCEVSPKSATISWDTSFDWSDEHWMVNRHEYNDLGKPLSIYEMHVGSWKWKNEQPMSYRDLAEPLTDYLQEMHFTHVEFMPIMEFPYDPSWGYQITGYFAPTSRFGDPQGFKYLIDHLHQAGIGVILDWVPSHFPEDEHGLAKFDGSHVYEHPDPRKGYHPDWRSMIFNFGRPEVKSFLISNAMYWLNEYHIDGLRVDAVASMIYLDYSRNEGEWEPNIHGGNEYLEAIEFLKDFNRAVYARHPSALTIAEESTAYPGVTLPADQGGLGFKLKWMMGWMHDTLKYFKEDPLFRSHHHSTITFSIYYAFSENFVLPFSHDEVVHGKSSLLGRMPGDEKDRFANLRAMYAYMYGHPGAKLLFMGAELGQYIEWKFDAELDWHLLDYPIHKGVQTLLKSLNLLYRNLPALHVLDHDQAGFEWIDYEDHERSIVSFRRKSGMENHDIIVICNLTPVERPGYKVNVDKKAEFEVILNSSDPMFGGRHLMKSNLIKSKRSGRSTSYSLTVDLPPMTVLYIQCWSTDEEE